MATPSLAMIPSAIADAKVYSVLPNNGDGDFTFNRDSSATRIGQNGLIQTVGFFGNELTTNGTFTGSATGWALSGTTAYNSNNIIFTGNGASNLLYQTAATISVGSVVKFEYEIISNTLNAGNLIIGGQGAADFANQTNLNSTVGVHSIYITAIAGSSSRIMLWISSSSTSGSLVLDNVSVKEVTGDQPRLNYDISNGVVQSCPSLLLEPASTNLVTYSEDFSNAYWTKSGSSVTSGFISPDGTNNAFKLVEGTTNSDHSIYATFTSLPSGIYTISAYVKKGERHKCALADRNSGIYVSFDLNNITVIAQGGMIGNIELLSNGWFKLSATTSNALTIIVPQIFILEDSYTTGLPIFQTYTGDGTSGVYIFGAQVEALSYATSYIPTNGAIQTRAAETCFGAGTSSTFNGSEGVIYAEFRALQDGYLSLTDGSSANRIFLGFASLSVYTQVRVDSIVSADMITSAYPSNTILKAAVKYKANDFALWVNGVEVDTDPYGATFPSGVLNNLSFNIGGGSSPFYGNTKDIRVYNEALTDAQLTVLTTL